jgi:hypothetical protein
MSSSEPRKPHDWSIDFGGKFKHARYEHTLERISGKNHYGIDSWLGGPINYLHVNAEIFKRTSKGLDFQKVSLGWPGGYWARIETLGAFERWDFTSLRVRAVVEKDGFRASWEGHGKGTDAVEISFRPVGWEKSRDGSLANLNIWLGPDMVYKREKDREFWKVGVRLNFKIEQKNP